MKVLRPWVLAALLTLAAAPAIAQGCTPAAGRLVSQQGPIDIQRAGAASWTAASPDATLCPGDALRLGERARAALRLSNGSTLRLDQNTTLVVTPPEAPDSLDLLRGAINVITRTPRPFKVRTPFINAGVEGTEFLVDAGLDAARIVVFEGRVVADNAAGRIPLTGGQEATAVSGGAPQRGLVLVPADAVQWTLHYPGVFGPRSGDPPLVKEAFALARRGEVDAALARLDAAASPLRRLGGLRAELLLMVGRVDDARAEIDRELRSDPSSSDARAMQALIAVVRNDVAAARTLAIEAIALDARSAAARVALSYAEQARFDIAAALAAALEAAALAPDAALPHARTAELQLASGQLADAIDSARRATALDAGSSRATTVLAFAQLMQAQTAAARQSFAAAIELDPADHLPRLGLGLALIREGQLADGREAIEIAVALDPLNSLARSYLGKAYFEEKRDAQAAVQFELAKSLDPNDPTPWFYDAILLQATNRPVEALQQFERSVALNDSRAVTRSRLLLDQDRATRQVGLAAVYTDLASAREAVALASRSLEQDPSNVTAHRFLSEAYAERERHDVARTSELLQAQLLQPLGLNTSSPELPFAGLGLPSSTLRATPFAVDATSVFERDRLGAWAALLAGNRGTRGAQALVSGMSGPVAASVGVFDFRNDGFRPNSDVSHTIGNAFVQAALTPTLTLQMEARDRRTVQGDVEQRFDPLYRYPGRRLRIDERVLRFGAAWRPRPETVWLVSSTWGDRDIDQSLSDSALNLSLANRDTVKSHELQLQQQTRWGSVVIGAGTTGLDATTRVDMDWTPLAGERCPPANAPCASVDRHDADHWSAYLYWNLGIGQDVSTTLGIAREHYADHTAVRIDRWQPKLGVRWAASPAVTWRAASVSTVKRPHLAQQTIEPTQVAGFNQFYDALDGALVRSTAVAVDMTVSPTLSFGGELGQQKLRDGSGFEGGGLRTAPEQIKRIDWLRLDVTSRASSALVASIGLKTERLRWDMTLPSADVPTKLMTTQLPLTLRGHFGSRYFAQVVTTAVWQQVERHPPSSGPQGHERFVVVDLSVGWRLPGRRGLVSMDVKNLFGTRFWYQDDNFLSTEIRQASLQPVRRWWVKASLEF